MIWDPINLTAILGAIAWPVCLAASVGFVCRVVSKSFTLNAEKAKQEREHQVAMTELNPTKGGRDGT